MYIQQDDRWTNGSPLLRMQGNKFAHFHRVICEIIMLLTYLVFILLYFGFSSREVNSQKVPDSNFCATKNLSTTEVLLGPHQESPNQISTHLSDYSYVN